MYECFMYSLDLGWAAAAAALEMNGPDWLFQQERDQMLVVYSNM